MLFRSSEIKEFENVERVECRDGETKRCQINHGGGLEANITVDDVMITGAETVLTEGENVKAELDSGECRIYGEVLACKREF